MFTDNYLKFQKARFCATSYSSAVTLKGAENASASFYGPSSLFSDIGCYMTTARCKAIIGSESSAYHYPSSNGYGGVYFGTGSTPANRADYKLESPITSGLTITNPGSLRWTEGEDGKFTAAAPFIVTNNTDAEINIWEIGVFTPVATSYKSAANSSQALAYCLMERTVLAEPITIPPGESKLVTYKLTFNQTLNVE